MENTDSVYAHPAQVYAERMMELENESDSHQEFRKLRLLEEFFETFSTFKEENRASVLNIFVDRLEDEDRVTLAHALEQNPKHARLRLQHKQERVDTSMNVKPSWLAKIKRKHAEIWALRHTNLIESKLIDQLQRKKITEKQSLVEFGGLNVLQLRQECGKRGLPRYGVKSALMQRLADYKGDHADSKRTVPTLFDICVRVLGDNIENISHCSEQGYKTLGVLLPDEVLEKLVWYLGKHKKLTGTVALALEVIHFSHAIPYELASVAPPSPTYPRMYSHACVHFVTQSFRMPEAFVKVHSTLSTALKASNDGDIILLAPGLYEIPYDEVSKNVEIIGQGERKHIMISKIPSFIRTCHIRLYNITVMGQSESESADVRVEETAFLELDSCDLIGISLQIAEGSSAIIRNCSIQRSSRYAVSISGMSEEVMLSGNTITQNCLVDAASAAVRFCVGKECKSSVLLENNVIKENRGHGIGIYSEQPNTKDVSQLLVELRPRIVLENNVIESNQKSDLPP